MVVAAGQPWASRQRKMQERPSVHSTPPQREEGQKRELIFMILWVYLSFKSRGNCAPSAAVSNHEPMDTSCFLLGGFNKSTRQLAPGRGLPAPPCSVPTS